MYEATVQSRFIIKEQPNNVFAVSRVEENTIKIKWWWLSILNHHIRTKLEKKINPCNQLQY